MTPKFQLLSTTKEHIPITHFQICQSSSLYSIQVVSLRLNFHQIEEQAKPMKGSTLWIGLSLFLIITKIVVAKGKIPTTLDGPFVPVTRRFDPSLRRGSDDLPMSHPRLKKNVTLNFPEQIALAISTPTTMWVSWVTGTFL